MNREILFRGKTEQGEWLYGSLERRDNIDLIDGYEITPPTQSDPCGDTVWITTKVLRETVGQYTGLEDKNGVKIFEGDIVKSVGRNIGVITYLYNEWVVIPTDEEMHWKRIGKSEDWIIIDNIHDNPGLLNPAS